MTDADPSRVGAMPHGLEPRFAVGIDLVAVDEVQTAVAHFGDRYLRRVFTEHELACSVADGSVRARNLAALYAAKEATMKALGSSDHMPAWRSIEVRQEPNGRCTLRLGGHAAELARRAGLTGFAVSVSHGRDLATAVVLALGCSEP